MDVLSKEQRHRNMTAIHSANTKPEITVRKYLFAHGFRFRINYSRLPGHPDIVLHKYRTCISSSMVAFGMDMKIANIMLYLNQTQVFGHKKYHAILIETNKYKEN